MVTMHILITASRIILTLREMLCRIENGKVNQRGVDFPSNHMAHT